MCWLMCSLDEAQVWHSNKSWRVYFCSFTITVLGYLLCSNTVVSGHWPLTTVLLHNRYRWLVVTCCDVDILRLHIRNNSRSPGSDNSTGERSLSPMCSRLMSISQRVTASPRPRCVNTSRLLHHMTQRTDEWLACRTHTEQWLDSGRLSVGMQGCMFMPNTIFVRCPTHNYTLKYATKRCFFLVLNTYTSI